MQNVIRLKSFCNVVFMRTGLLIAFISGVVLDSVELN